jgi:hypothetical protein
MNKLYFTSSYLTVEEKKEWRNNCTFRGIKKRKRRQRLCRTCNCIILKKQIMQLRPKERKTRVRNISCGQCRYVSE